MEVVELQLASHPADLEAKGWRARLLAWSGKYSAAESEYRAVLGQAPNDSDLIIGLANVLSWDERFDEALAELEHAPSTAEVLLLRARLLERLNRPADAAETYREVLLRDPHSAAAKAALSEAPELTRHELVIGADTDRFNYTDTATAQGLTLTSRWNRHWTTGVSTTFYQRFGEGAQRMNLRVSRTLGNNSWLSVNGGAANDGGVIPKREAGMEIGRAFRVSRNGWIRGVETSVAHQWLWFRASRVQVTTGTAMLYLPREWTFTVSGGAARSSFAGQGVEWEPTGSARLSFPAGLPHVTATLAFAVGAENFAKADEIGHFSARTFGGGVRYEWTRRQFINTGVYFQDRSQGRTQTTVAVGYGLRF